MDINTVPPYAANSPHQTNHQNPSPKSINSKHPLTFHAAQSTTTKDLPLNKMAQSALIAKRHDSIPRPAHPRQRLDPFAMAPLARDHRWERWRRIRPRLPSPLVFPLFFVFKQAASIAYLQQGVIDTPPPFQHVDVIATMTTRLQLSLPLLSCPSLFQKPLLSISRRVFFSPLSISVPAALA
jgi:hypothetical protein